MDDLTALRDEIRGLTTLVEGVKGIYEDMSERVGRIERWIPTADRVLRRMQAHMSGETRLMESDEMPLPFAGESSLSGAASADNRTIIIGAGIALLTAAALAVASFFIARGGLPCPGRPSTRPCSWRSSASSGGARATLFSSTC